MRPRFVFFILILAAMILTVVFWLRPIKRIAIEEPTQGSAQSFNPQASSGNVSNQNVPHTSLPATSLENQKPSDKNNSISSGSYLQYIKSKNASIEFYGEVIDQDSNALAGAKIRIGIRHWTVGDPAIWLPGSKTIYLTQTSDANGRFELHGATGDGFGIGITKSGYELEPNRYGFGPSAGSYDNPVIFKMWSTNIHEQLITGDNSFEVKPDGRPYFINLKNGTISEHEKGELKIWIQYTNQVVQGQLCDWSAGIEVINGGLLEVAQAHINSGFLAEPPFAMYSAPIDGYVPLFSYKCQIKGGQSGEIGNRYFYLRLNHGKEYGRISINLFAPYGHLHPGLIRISYAINPSGSRILR